MDENTNTTQASVKKTSSTPKMLILGIIVVSLLGIGGYFFLMNDNDQDDMTNPTAQTAAPTTSDSQSMQDNNAIEGSVTSNQTYTLADVAEHSTPDDCWLVIKGNVYDVTPFIKSASHPGGAEILKGCGIDATELYTSRPGSGTEHSQRAYEMLPNYLIGTLAN